MSIISDLFDKAMRHGRAYIVQASNTVDQNGSVEVLLVPSEGHRIIVGLINLSSTAESLKLRLLSGTNGQQSSGTNAAMLNVNLEYRDTKLVQAIVGSVVSDEVEDIAIDVIGLSNNKHVTAPAAGGRDGVTCICPSKKVVRILLENLDSTSKTLAFSFTVFAVPDSDCYPNWYNN